VGVLPVDSLSIFSSLAPPTPEESTAFTTMESTPAAVRALEDPALWKDRSVRSVRRAAEFSWDESARRLLAAAEEAVALRKQGRRRR